MNVNYSNTLIVGGTALIGALIVFFGYNQIYKGKKDVKPKKKIDDIVKELPNSFNVDETLNKHKNIEMISLNQTEDNQTEDNKLKVEEKVEEKKSEQTKKVDPLPTKVPKAINKKLNKKAPVPSAPPLEIDNEDDSIMEIPNKNENAVKAQDLLRDMSVDTVKELPKKKRRGRKKKKPKAKEV